VGYAGDALSFDTLGGWVDSDTNMSRALDQVSQAVCGTPGLPVIVGVRSPSTGHYVGHFVLVTGQISNPDGSVAFTINDPYDPITLIGIDQQTGNSGYLNPSTNLPEFTTKGTVHDPAVLTGLSVIVDDVVNLMVTDPNGFQSGYSLGNSIPLQNIPNSGAGVDEIDDEVTGQAGSPVQTVLVNGAAAGTFQVSVTGTTAAPYTLQIVSEASDGSIQTFSSPGTAAIGVTTIYGVSFTGTPGGAGIATINGSPVSACDVGYQGTTSVSDVQISINQALGAASPANDLNGDGVVNVVDVQIVIKAALGLRCTAR
jgi:hypothetical protein